MTKVLFRKRPTSKSSKWVNDCSQQINVITCSMYTNHYHPLITRTKFEHKIPSSDIHIPTDVINISHIHTSRRTSLSGRFCQQIRHWLMCVREVSDAVVDSGGQLWSVVLLCWNMNNIMCVCVCVFVWVSEWVIQTFMIDSPRPLSLTSPRTKAWRSHHSRRQDIWPWWRGWCPNETELTALRIPCVQWMHVWWHMIGRVVCMIDMIGWLVCMCGDIWLVEWCVWLIWLVEAPLTHSVRSPPHYV